MHIIISYRQTFIYININPVKIVIILTIHGYIFILYIDVYLYIGE